MELTVAAPMLHPCCTMNSTHRDLGCTSAFLPALPAADVICMRTKSRLMQNMRVKARGKLRAN